MRIAILSAYDHGGGGSIAALRLHRGLLAEGADSHMIVQSARSDATGVEAPSGKFARFLAQLRPDLDQLALHAYPHREGFFSPGVLWDDVVKRVDAIRPDIVHVHWINGGFMRPESLRRLRYPLVWTMHDLWALTGGCHYDDGCGRFRTQCGTCPALGSSKANDLAARGQRRKAWAYSRLDLTAVAPSEWMADCIEQSTLLGEYPVEVIANPIDLNRFKPYDRHFARSVFGLPADAKVILFGAANATSDPRKGFAYLQQALRQFSATTTQPVLLVVFGATSGPGAEAFGLPTRYVGRLGDEVALALLYSACDVFVAPSLQDNLPNTIAEALACGLPTVAFKVGGIPDLVLDEVNGRLCAPGEALALADGIAWVLADEDRRAGLARAARAQAQSLIDAHLRCHDHLSLYARILARRSMDERSGARADYDGMAGTARIDPTPGSSH